MSAVAYASVFAVSFLSAAVSARWRDAQHRDQAEYDQKRIAKLEEELANTKRALARARAALYVHECDRFDSIDHEACHKREAAIHEKLAAAQQEIQALQIRLEQAGKGEQIIKALETLRELAPGGRT